MARPSLPGLRGCSRVSFARARLERYCGLVRFARFARARPHTTFISMLLLNGGLVLFLGIHLLPAIPALRASAAEQWGERRYKGVFSLVSAIGLVMIVAGYMIADPNPRVFAPFPAARRIAPYAMTLSFILFAAANMRGHLRHAVRHPMLLGLGTWAAVHLLANGDLRGTVLFGAFLAFAVVDLFSAVQRGAVKAFVPEGKFDGMAVAGGTAVALVVMLLHRFLFGVPAAGFSL
jgi:uncharacterized membrane protein